MNYDEYIEAYVLNELSEAEKKAFETGMAVDAGLRERVREAWAVLRAVQSGPPPAAELEMVQGMRDAVNKQRETLFERFAAGDLSADEQAKFRKRLKEEELFDYQWRQYKTATGLSEPATTSLRFSITYRWLAAAAAAAVLALIVWQFGIQPGLRAEALYTRYHAVPALQPKAAYALIDESLLHLGPAETDTSRLKADGLRAFESGNWDQSIRLLSEFITLQKQRPTEPSDEVNLMHLYIGKAYLETGKTETAIESLQRADSGFHDLNNYARLRELTRWHLALAHLQHRDPAAAARILHSLQDARVPEIRENAQELLKELP